MSCNYRDSGSFGIRLATVDDVGSIAEHRVKIFLETEEVPSREHKEALREASVTALRAGLIDGTYRGWIATAHDRSIVGGAGLHIKPQLPRIAPGDLRVESGPVPLVVNVYTEVSWRRKGVARALMNAMLQWARVAEFDRVVLHATQAAASLYRSIGFEPTGNEMRWVRSRR